MRTSHQSKRQVNVLSGDLLDRCMRSKWTLGHGRSAGRGTYNTVYQRAYQQRQQYPQMPIDADDNLRKLLANGSITGVTLDTNMFDRQRLNLKSPTFRAIASLKDIPFSFILSATVAREVQGHLAKSMEEALRTAKKAVGDALYAFDTEKPTRDELLNQITDGKAPAEAAAARFDVFLRESECEVLGDSSLVDVATLFDAYFNRQPPFSHGKKAEFPDALALKALDRAAAVRQSKFLVVSDDADWRAFCEDSQHLYLVPQLERALGLINNAPLGLRRAVVTWFSDGQEGRNEVGLAISNFVEGLDVDAYAYPTSGEVETHAWAPVVRSMEWPADEDIDIIETEECEDGRLTVVVSLPVLVQVQVSVDLDFSVWDSVDRESVGMGGRTIEVDRDVEARVTVTIDLRAMGEVDEGIELLSVEVDPIWLHVDLGEVDVFEPEDYDTSIE